MKRFTSLFLVATLVLSLALILGACGKDKAVDVDNTASESVEAEESSEKSVKEQLSEIENRPERSTGEHYSEEYEKLTLPSEDPTTTKADKQNDEKETTTKKNDTKVTTTKQSLATTTKRATAELTTKKKETTTKKGDVNAPQINTDLFSQTEVFSEVENNIGDEYVGFGGGVTPGEVTKPEVTYYQKYVEDVIQSKNYTMKVQMDEAGQSVTLEVFSNGDQKAYKGTAKYSGTTMSFRFFEKNGKAYVVLPSFLIYFEEDGSSGFTEGFDEAMLDAYSIVDNPDLVYCGVKSGVGYICEMYKDTVQNVGYNFYFSSKGLTKVETVDLSSGERISNTFSLTTGVEDKKVFEIPKGYTKTDIENLEATLGGMLG